MTHYLGDSVFWIEVDKIDPNPYQPRRDFDEARLKDLSESIRQYGVLQPLVVTRKEFSKDDGGLTTRYELIAGERRLRASKLAGLREIPALIRSNADDSRVKLELAIIENLQREDLNAVDRAKAFERLSSEFGFKHTQIAEKVGKSREYVSNTLRILSLPQEMLDALSAGKISEGHTRPLLMLSERPEEQVTLFKEITYKKLSVRETEAISRRIATDKVRKKELIDPEMIEMEKKLTESLGTRVRIERKESGGKITIDFFSPDDLHMIIDHMKSNEAKDPNLLMNRFIAGQQNSKIETDNLPQDVDKEEKTEPNTEDVSVVTENTIQGDAPLDDSSREEKEKAEEELYSVSNFTI